MQSLKNLLNAYRKPLIVIVTLGLFCSCETDKISEEDQLVIEAALGKMGEDKQAAVLMIDRELAKTATPWLKHYLLYIKGYCLQKENPTKALNLYQESLRFLEKSGVDTEQARNNRRKLLKNLGAMFHKHHKYSIAIDYYRRALDEAEKEEHPSLRYNLSLSLNKLGASDEALQELIQAKEELEELGVKDANRVAKIFSKMGTMYTEAGEYELADEYHNSVLEIPELSVRNQARAWHNLGYNYMRAGDSLNSLHAYEKSLKFRKGNDQFRTLVDMVSIESRLNPKRAIELGEKAITLQPNVDKEVLDLYKALKFAYRNLGNVVEALNISNTLDDLTASQYSNQEIVIRDELSFKVDMMQINYENAINKESERDSLVWWTVVIIAAGLILLSFLYRNIRSRRLAQSN